MRRRPLFGDLLIGGLIGIVLLGFAVEKTDGIGDALDGGLLHFDRYGLLVVRGFDFAFVRVDIEATLHENLCAFGEPSRQFGVALSVGDNIVPSGSFVFAAVCGFPGLLGGNGEACDLRAF